MIIFQFVDPVGLGWHLPEEVDGIPIHQEGDDLSLFKMPSLSPLTSIFFPMDSSLEVEERGINHLGKEGKVHRLIREKKTPMRFQV